MVMVAGVVTNVMVSVAMLAAVRWRCAKAPTIGGMMGVVFVILLSGSITIFNFQVP